MAQVASDATAWAKPRVGWFFPGVVPSLDGQCVSLAKWFMQDMSDVPNPQAARGDARYVGQTLVSQGHAVEVPEADRRRGDIVCWEYGVYGHIEVYLGGDQVFGQNVNIPGTTSKVVDGSKVYSAIIYPLYTSWRPVKPKFYRLKTYKEGNSMQPTTFNQLQQMSHAVLGRTTPVTKAWYDANPAERNLTTDQVLDRWIPSDEAKNFRYKAWDYDRLAKEFADYKANNPISNERCTPDERAYLDALKKVTQ